MAEFKNCKLELKLRAQTPLIHFQHAQVGATLRASEVKPKLDKFIIGKLRKEADISQGADEKEAMKKLKELYKGFFQSTEVTEDPKKDSAGNDKEKKKEEAVNNALKYKMQIFVTERVEVVDISKYPIYYGNMTNDRDIQPEDLRQGVLSKPTISILCFHTALQEYIAKYIEEFFLVTNFGTMQGKGFGSFAPVEYSCPKPLSEDQKKTIAGYLKDAAEAPRCYGMIFKENRTYHMEDAVCIDMFGQIRDFYGIMKSGRNHGGYARSYIYEYAHKKLKLSNEKAWMKQNAIAPKPCRKAIQKKYDAYDAENRRVRQEPRYVRAMLGVGGFIDFGSEIVERNGREVLGKNKEKVTITNAELDRVSSPIFFKVVNNVVFIVARQIPEEVYDKEFTFLNTAKEGERKGNSGKLHTPVKGTFDIQDFLKEYIYYYNSNATTDKYSDAGLRSKFRNLERNARVVEIK